MPRHWRCALPTRISPIAGENRIQQRFATRARLPQLPQDRQRLRYLATHMILTQLSSASSGSSGDLRRPSCAQTFLASATDSATWPPPLGLDGCGCDRYSAEVPKCPSPCSSAACPRKVSLPASLQKLTRLRQHPPPALGVVEVVSAKMCGWPNMQTPEAPKSSLDAPRGDGVAGAGAEAEAEKVATPEAIGVDDSMPGLARSVKCATNLVAGGLVAGSSAHKSFIKAFINWAPRLPSVRIGESKSGRKPRQTASANAAAVQRKELYGTT
mmetsp:Transcript_113217/g.283461  ORF Transcript_113217/g.283461 Transcript_113217/m.283461 type:complete len:270 (-) Transcript_113217:815-1624(-)